MILKYKGIKVNYSSVGNGTAVILLHGFLENKSMWKPFISKLSKQNRVVTIDLLGHGKTGCLGYVHSMEDMAAAVSAVLSYLRLRRVIFIGHSMGGYISLAFAEQFPDMVKGICLMNSTPKADTEEKKINRERAIDAVKNNHKSFVRISVTNLFRPKNRTIFKSELNKVKEEALKIPVERIIAALAGMKVRTDRTQLFQKGNFKKQLIIGKHDPVLDYNSLIELTKDTDIDVVEFSDGHMSHIENEAEFLTTLLHFIEKI